ncbi:MAG: class I SAM-dependent methyltransferase [Deltaproteobacteria bacterium]|nr:MAG: class I SAM-dependent methyltransferase [Deltaproteobacteria bacterium]
MTGKPSFWARRVLPVLVEKGCRSRVILQERLRWIPRAHGDVVELGVGTGLNLAFYDANRVSRVTGVDPSPPLLAQAGVRAARAPVEVELVEAPAEQLPFDAEAFERARWASSGACSGRAAS